MTSLLESPRELADRVGVSVASIRELIRERKLDHIFLTSGQRNPKIPAGAWERYINLNMVRACPDQSENPNSKSIARTRMGTSTSMSPKAEKAGNSQLSRATAKKLSSSGTNGALGAVGRR